MQASTRAYAEMDHIHIEEMKKMIEEMKLTRCSIVEIVGSRSRDVRRQAAP